MPNFSVTPEMLAKSVLSVPPLARKADYTLDREGNRQILAHLAQGGVTTALYGGNANLYNISVREFADGDVVEVGVAAIKRGGHAALRQMRQDLAVAFAVERVVGLACQGRHGEDRFRKHFGCHGKIGHGFRLPVQG